MTRLQPQIGYHLPRLKDLFGRWRVGDRDGRVAHGGGAKCMCMYGRVLQPYLLLRLPVIVISAMRTKMPSLQRASTSTEPARNILQLGLFQCLAK
jgi:hypothetical protein